MKKENNFGDKINTNGFDKNKGNININGRPVSIKKQLKELLLNSGEYSIPVTDLIRKTDTDYIFKIPTQESLALKLLDIAMTKNSNNLNAIKLILETFDGKAKQEVENKIDIRDRIKGITFNPEE